MVVSLSYSLSLFLSLTLALALSINTAFSSRNGIAFSTMRNEH